MAEYKNGFNAFGGMPVDSSRLASDVQTGRAVYVDDDEYSEETGYKNKVDSVVREGYHEEAPFEVPEIVVPTPIIPNGTKNITENGVYDVREFANADVNVAEGGGETWATLTEESVTTIVEEGEPAAYKRLAYSELITADTIKVIFNGTEYTCSKITEDDRTYYGGVGEQGPDFSEYPFAVVSLTDSLGSYNNLITESAGTYQVKIEVPQSGGSSDFSTATVTFVNNTGFSSAAYVPNCVEENALGSGTPAMVVYVVSIPDATPVVANVPLYKGACDGFWDTNDEQFEISVSGDAVLISSGDILITGDCTITIS